MANAKKKKAAKVTTRVVESGDTVVPKKQKTDKKSVKVAPKEAQISKKENKKSAKKSKKKKIGYFKGAWIELKQVRWPDRKSTWGMTFAVVLFTLFFVVLILLLDAGFKYLFEKTKTYYIERKYYGSKTLRFNSSMVCSPHL